MMTISGIHPEFKKMIDDYSKETGMNRSSLMRQSIRLMVKSNYQQLRSGDWEGLYNYITNPKFIDPGGNHVPILIFGGSGAGKSYTIKEMLKNIKPKFKICLIDPLDEYSRILPKKEVISKEHDRSYRFVPQSSVRLDLVEQIELDRIIKDLKRTYKNGDGWVVFIDESHRWQTSESIMREIRHYFRAVFISNKKFAKEGFPLVEIVKPDKII